MLDKRLIDQLGNDYRLLLDLTRRLARVGIPPEIQYTLEGYLSFTRLESPTFEQWFALMTQFDMAWNVGYARLVSHSEKQLESWYSDVLWYRDRVE